MGEYIMSGSRAVFVSLETNISRSSGSLSKSAADKVMWSLWTMGEEEGSQDETDFKLDGKQGAFTFSKQEKESKETVESNHQKYKRIGSTTELSSSGSQRMQRKNSETMFNLEY